MDAHDGAVAIIAANIRQFYDRQEPFRIYHGSTNSTRQSQYWRNNIIDTSGLTNVLLIDREKMTALVEPNVPMDGLVEETLRHGLVPPVVMEFPGITVGGGFSGTSGESSSFRYGFFDRTIKWIEVVLPNGEKVTASSTERPDLFRGAAAAFGTLGVVTLLEVQLIEAKKYVELTYHPTSDISQAMQKMKEVTDDTSNDYLDGIVFAMDRIVVCSGRLTDNLPDGARVQQFTRAQDPWFYIHTRKQTSQATSPIVEFIPLVDYLFRYDRGGFWVGKYAFTYFITPFNRVSRYFLDRFMHTRVMYHALHQSGHSKRYIIQDVAVPYQAVEEFLQWLDDNFGLYPLWLCPLRQRGKAADSPHGLLAEKADLNAPEYLMNFGVWGPGSKNRQEFVRQNRKLEQKVQDLQGKKWLYAHAYYTEDEFWAIYGRKEYDALRTKYHATYLPNLYDKVKVDVSAEEKAIQATLIAWLSALFWSIWPLSGLYGVYKAWMGGDYLLQKEKTRWIQAVKEKE
jgi:Delta24-sterol reductase